MNKATENKGLCLPRLVSDGMVLQRETKVRIWGWAKPKARITVSFMGSIWEVVTDSSGKWQVMMQDLVAGGPYEMEIQSSLGEVIVIKDILIGDVWLCAGQSNMELPMARVKDDFSQDVKACDNTFIRMYKIKEHYDFHGPSKDLHTGKWQEVSAQTILDFSATSYYFQKFMYEANQIPIGVINASLGGSPIEAWMSQEMLEEFGEYDEEIAKSKDDAFIQEQLKKQEEIPAKWHEELARGDAGLKDEEKTWYLENLGGEDWEEIKLPNFFETQGIKDFNGAIWFRKRVKVPKSMAGKEAKLWLGTIVDSDETYLNGIKVGSTGYQYPPRKYEVPKGLLKEGENILTVRVVCNKGGGRFTPNKMYKLFTDQESVDLTGVWKYKIGAEAKLLKDTRFVSWRPTGLYNGMLAPCHSYTIRGVLWYQGESNTKEPDKYHALFVKMITSWREKWNQDSLPFIYVQLPNFKIDLQEDERWPKVREAQRRALELPDTAMVVAIDLGEENDLHPVNKKDIGYRASLAARAIALHEKIEYSGPVVTEVERREETIILRFSHAESGLRIQNEGNLEAFEIAGADGVFKTPKVEIGKEEVFLSHEQMNNPMVVRYAYRNQPIGRLLYNQEGLPASPFYQELEGAIQKRNKGLIT